MDGKPPAQKSGRRRDWLRGREVGPPGLLLILTVHQGTTLNVEVPACGSLGTSLPIDVEGSRAGRQAVIQISSCSARGGTKSLVINTIRQQRSSDSLDCIAASGPTVPGEERHVNYCTHPGCRTLPSYLPGTFITLNILELAVHVCLSAPAPICLSVLYCASKDEGVSAGSAVSYLA